MVNRETLLQYVLYILSFFYLVGAVAHYFGLTIFPWFDGALYSPYHDSIIAMAAIAMMILLYLIATDVKKYAKLIDGLSVIALVNGLLTLYMAYSVDFGAYAQNDKQLQAVVEGVLLIVVSASLYYLNRKN